MSRNIKRLQIRANASKNFKGVHFLVKFQDLNLKLCQKINSTASIFQLICLPFKSTCFRKDFKEKVRILKCNVYYVTKGF